MQTIVIGHRNPDMDSICSALAYAEFKRLSGISDVLPARAGSTNERIDYVLHRFGFESPALLTDVSPRVEDVMESRVVSVRGSVSVYDALQLIERKQLRGLPVVDDANRCLGLLSAFKLSHYLFPPREESGATRIVNASLNDIVSTFAGSVITGVARDEVAEQLLVVAAMALESFAPRLRHYAGKRVVLIVGDRPHIHELAINAGLQAVVVTGGFGVSAELREAAEKKGVTLISSPYDTATTLLLARGAVRVERVLLDEYTSFPRAMLLEEARRIAAESAGFIFPVLDERGALVGILSKSDFLKPIPRQLILVDHNELTQAVRGADRLPILEVLDHHRLGGFTSLTPMLFWNNPVGSTSSIVAMCYRQAAIDIPPGIAGLLMAGLISDTLLLTSPTTTESDRSLLQLLSTIARVDPKELASSIFSVGSPLLTMSPAQAIMADSKLYEDGGHRFSVSQIEELTFAHFEEQRSALLAALEDQRVRDGLLFAALLVTDINTETSLLLLRGPESLTRILDYPEAGAGVWELAGVVSRKKQLLPYLLKRLHRLEGQP